MCCPETLHFPRLQRSPFWCTESKNKCKRLTGDSYNTTILLHHKTPLTMKCKLQSRRRFLHTYAWLKPQIQNIKGTWNQKDGQLNARRSKIPEETALRTGPLTGLTSPWIGAWHPHSPGKSNFRPPHFRTALTKQTSKQNPTGEGWAVEILIQYWWECKSLELLWKTLWQGFLKTEYFHILWCTNCMCLNK